MFGSMGWLSGRNEAGVKARGDMVMLFSEYAFSVAGMYFDYGFVKGMRYAKAQFKKRQKKV